MDLDHLRMFTAVAELGNLTLAAERLHISQPAASAQIKQLEERFKIVLFERKSSGLKLTAAGASLLPMVQQFLATANEIMTHARNISGHVSGIIKFGTVTSMVDASIPWMAEVINRIITKHPLLEIELQHNQSSDIKLGVSHGELDVGLVAGNKQVPGLRHVFLQELYYHVVASEVWRDRVQNASWKDLAALPWVCCSGTQYEMVMQLFKGRNFLPEKFVKANSQQLTSSLVMGGAGIGLMPEDAAVEAEKVGNVFIVDKERTASTALQFIYRVGRDNDPAIKTILQVIQDLWPQPAQGSQKAIAEM
jgi:DNA-binding transcriptional LysR family regulator